MKLLVTGAAGFIGYVLADKLCQRGDDVIGIDNLNNYYDQVFNKKKLSEYTESEWDFAEEQDHWIRER